MRWTIGITFVSVVSCGVLFEHFRFIATKRIRQKSLTKIWDEKLEPQHPITDFLQLAMDWAFYPITNLMGWLSFTDISNNNIFSSIIVGGRFVNPFREWDDRNILDLFAYIRYRLTRVNRNAVPNDITVLQETLPVMIPDFELLETYTDHSNNDALPELFDDFAFLTCTWFGQSTCFVQMDGYNILTDPIFRYSSS
jgi:hypothetical protein